MNFRATSPGELAPPSLGLHAENAACPNLSLDVRDGDANARSVDLQTEASVRLTQIEAAWRCMGAAGTTHVAAVEPRPELPPRDLYRRKTSEWQPVRFLGIVTYRHPADKELPLQCQHTLADLMDEVEADHTIDCPVSAVANSAAVRNGRSSVPDSGEESSSADERPAFTREMTR